MKTNRIAKIPYRLDKRLEWADRELGFVAAMVRCGMPECQSLAEIADRAFRLRIETQNQMARHRQ